jgi:hypothetical protein
VRRIQDLGRDSLGGVVVSLFQHAPDVDPQEENDSQHLVTQRLREEIL